MARDLRICFIGDSFVNGTGDEAYQGWTGRVSAQLRARGWELTAYNLGIRRDTSADILARWRDEAGRRLPDHVDGRLVFSFGINDCVMEGGKRRVAAADSLRHAARILDAAAAWKRTLVVGPPTLMGGAGGIDEGIRAIADGLRDRCVALAIPYIDLFDPLAGQPEWKGEMDAGDGIHPGAAGYERIAAIILAWTGWDAWLGGGRRQ